MRVTIYTDYNKSVVENCIDVGSLDWLDEKYAGRWQQETETEPVIPSKRILTKLEYMDKFTDDELAAIYTAAKTTVQVEIWLEKFKAATEVNLDDPRIVSGIQALETIGLLSTGRAQEILS